MEFTINNGKDVSTARPYLLADSTLEEIMPLAKILSDAQIDLIKRLIEFAEENDFFSHEFDGEEEREFFHA
jgi:hypothetical protein